MSEIRVDDSAIEVAALQMSHAAHDLEAAYARLAAVEIPPAGDADEAQAPLDGARLIVGDVLAEYRTAAERAHHLSTLLVMSASLYRGAEATATGLAQTLLQTALARAGLLLRVALSIPGLREVVVIGAVAVGALATGGMIARSVIVSLATRGRLPNMTELVMAMSEPFGSRILPTIIRIGVEYSDEVLAGTPTPFKPAVITRGAYSGMTSRHKPSTTRVSVKPVPNAPTSITPSRGRPGGAPAGITKPPSGYGAIVDRIPGSDDKGPQVRITTYLDENGEEFHEVLVAGTSNQGFADSPNVLDHYGNAAAYSNIDAESLAAVRQAMAEAGIEHGDRVVFGGYSQGGIVAAQLAASGDWNTELLVTAGSPVGDIRQDPSTTMVEFVHDEDIVPALEGMRDPGVDQSTVITRSVQEEAEAKNDLFEPHSQRLYVETAYQADESNDAGVHEAKERFGEVYGNAEVVDSTAYRLEREG